MAPADAPAPPTPPTPPLSYFDPSAACEKTAARNYYAATASASCISIMGMDNWQCILGPRSLSVAATNAVITIIFLIVTGAYFYRAFAAPRRARTGEREGEGQRARARTAADHACFSPPPFSRVRGSLARSRADMWYFRKVHHIVFPCKRLND